MPQKIDGYEITRTLGKGAQAKVKLAKQIDSGDTFAIKLMFDAKTIDSEVANIVNLSHPNLVNVKQCSASSVLVKSDGT